MPWTLLESVTENDARLELYSRDGIFMIRANGLELMSGFCHDSEMALGQLAAQLAPAREPRILIGGLGLGYTVAALTDALGTAGTITVAELSGAVIAWFQRYVKPSVLPMVAGNLTIIRADIAELLSAGHAYDVIVLDVDNGPEPLVRAGNAALYSQAGLAALRAALAADGVALLWSGFESEDFAARARAAGFAVACKPFSRARPDLAHYIYALGRSRAALRHFA